MARGHGSGWETESSPRRVGAEVGQQAPGPEGLSCPGGVGLGQGVGQPKVPGQEVPEAKAREGTGQLRCSGAGWQGEVAPGQPCWPGSQPVASGPAAGLLWDGPAPDGPAARGESKGPGLAVKVLFGEVGTPLDRRPLV